MLFGGRRDGEETHYSIPYRWAGIYLLSGTTYLLTAGGIVPHSIIRVREALRRVPMVGVGDRAWPVK